jgi:hypothetical protein
LASVTRSPARRHVFTRRRSSARETIFECVDLLND